MARKKSRGGRRKKKPVGRPKKVPDGVTWEEHNATIWITKDTKDLLNKLRHKDESNYDDTIKVMIEIMRKIGKDYIAMEKPIPKDVLDGIYAMERKARIEEGEI